MCAPTPHVADALCTASSADAGFVLVQSHFGAVPSDLYAGGCGWLVVTPMCSGESGCMTSRVVLLPSFAFYAMRCSARGS
eukprot:4420279-Heterocapsa_arctica.AAC.1